VVSAEFTVDMTEVGDSLVFLAFPTAMSSEVVAGRSLLEAPIFSYFLLSFSLQ
jgi:hypothetical protein